ncbi:MAG TPA: DMT family transporter [Bacteroidia bacterium]|nr:DMT family transporter [Bacteroidia bacterium]
MNKTIPAHLSLFTAMAIYAAGFSLIKEVTPHHVFPQGFVALRILGATPLLWLSGLFIREKVERKDLRKLAILSACGVIINQSLFVRGMSMTSPISGAIIMITSPLLVLVLGNIVLKEKITWQKLSGIVIGGAGIILLSTTRKDGNEGSVLGDVFIFLNAVSWGTFLVLVKPLMKKYHTITILKWVFLFGAIVLIPAGIPDLLSVQWSDVHGRLLFDICFVVFAVTYFAYIMNTYALKALSPAVVSAYIYLQPVMAAGIALYLGIDHLSKEKIFSAVLIFAGVFLASQNKKVVEGKK